MIQPVNVPTTVILLSNHKKRVSSPAKILWEGKSYLVTQVGLHHTYRQGRTLHHVFSVACGTLGFRLNLNTDNLSWRIEEVSDGEVN